jgi:hypothetical protein
MKMMASIEIAKPNLALLIALSLSLSLSSFALL